MGSETRGKTVVEWPSLSPEKPGYDTGNGTERRASEQEGVQAL